MLSMEWTSESLKARMMERNLDQKLGFCSVILLDLELVRKKGYKLGN